MKRRNRCRGWWQLDLSKCLASTEIEFHFLVTCANWGRRRRCILGTTAISRDKLRHQRWNEISSFIKKIGRVSERIRTVLELGECEIGFGEKGL